MRVSVPYIVAIGMLAGTVTADTGGHEPKGVDSLGIESFAYVLSSIEANYYKQVSNLDLIYSAAANMLAGLDPHSAFLPPRSFQQMRDDTSGEFGGVGLMVTKMPGSPLVVEKPIEGTPAAKAGLKKGDRIVAVDGALTSDMDFDEAIDRMKGRRGTVVVLTVERDGWQKPRDFRIVRDYIKVKSVDFKTLEPGFGYLHISMFSEHTDFFARQGIKKLIEDNGGIKGMLLDLRDNPGGLLDQAVRVAELFMDQGKVVSTVGRNGRKEELFARGKDMLGGAPLVVLVDAGSASAAEILAGALQDHRRALILGEPTFGKGSVQSIIELEDGSGMKLTVARYYTPSNRSIQEKGIIPDIHVTPPSSWTPPPGVDPERVDDYMTFVGLETLKAWSRIASKEQGFASSPRHTKNTGE